MAPTQQQGSSASSTDNCYNNSASSVNTNKTTESKSNFSSSINKSQSFSSNSSSSSLNNSSSSALHNSNDLNNSCKEINNAFDQHLLNFGSSTNLATILPVTTRGPFYHDTFFQDTRQHYDSAVREVLDNWGQRSELDDDLTTYRKLREVDLTDASQATTVSEDDTHHQVVMDVVDFPRECVRVKVVDENELVVEGSVDQREGTSTSTKSFCRRFTFPGLVRSEVVTSTMSSDGVLTITVPKKVCGKREIAVKEDTVKTKTHKLENSHKLTDTTSMNSNTTKRNAFDCSKIKEEDKSRTQKNVSMHKTKETSVTSEDTLNKEQKSATNEATTNPLLNSSKQLPITSKGDFFQDSHFAHVREDFEAAVQRVLKSWNETSEDDVMTSYRNLRTRDLKEDNQAVSLTEDAKQHKVVLDVHDFPRECVKVKVVDENELVVEGSVDQREGTSTSTKSFCRRFTFPGLVRSEVVTSTMSSDGVLTITVPKKICDKREIAVNEETVKTKPQQLKNSQKKTDTTSTINDTAKRDSFDCSKEEKSQTQKNVSYQKTKETSVGSEDTSANQQKSATNEATTNLLNSSNQLPITSKGDFFQDSHFAHVREDFEAAVQRVLKSWNETSEDDVMTSYRNLRTRDLKEDNQAVSLTEDAKQHKVVLDVHDFPRECVRVKVVDENELVVEGSVDQREGTSTSTKSFCRRFTFPGLVRPEVVTSTMSSDGVLTITVPKKESSKEQELNMKTTTTNSNRNVSTENSLKDQVNLKNALSDSADDQTSTSNSYSSISNMSRGYSSQVTEEMKKSSASVDDHLSSTATIGSESFFPEDSLLSVDKKGLFFHDDFFQNARQDYESAINEVLTRFSLTQPASDDLSTYRSLRQTDFGDESQAMKVTEVQDTHKVVMDVRDFMKGDIKVKMVGEKEVEVDGVVVEEKEGANKSTRRFNRRVHLPDMVDVEAVTSAMSSDGVLTITAPKVVKK